MLFCKTCQKFSEVRLSHDTSCPLCGSIYTEEYDSHKYAEYWRTFTACENRWREPIIRVMYLKDFSTRRLHALLSTIPDREYCNELGMAIPNPYKKHETNLKSL